MHGKILSSQALRTPFTALPEDISRLALFLDIDGMLIDIAPTPDAVAVPPGLAEALARLSARLDGALALVTGRAIATADELIAGGTIPVGGLHGAERRDAAGHIVSAVATPAFSRARARLGAETACWPGVICELKAPASPRSEAKMTTADRRIVSRSVVRGCWTFECVATAETARVTARAKGEEARTRAIAF